MYNTVNYYQSPDLRDQFAMHVLPVILEAYVGNKNDAVQAAYELADLMLLARKKKEV